MRKLIETNHVSLGGEVGTTEWALPYLDEDHNAYATQLLFGADTLLLGRKTYEGLSAAYQAMQQSEDEPNEFVDRMNSIPKYVASTTFAKQAGMPPSSPEMSPRLSRTSSNSPATTSSSTETDRWTSRCCNMALSTSSTFW
jgi:hypothetical protein